MRLCLGSRSINWATELIGNSNSGLVTATTLGNQLTLTYAAGQSGTATIIIRATDLDGSSVDQTLTVTVN